MNRLPESPRKMDAGGKLNTVNPQVLKKAFRGAVLQITPDVVYVIAHRARRQVKLRFQVG